jgi:hypothetical protein
LRGGDVFANFLSLMQLEPCYSLLVGGSVFCLFFHAKHRVMIL